MGAWTGVEAINAVGEGSIEIGWLGVEVCETVAVVSGCFSPDRLSWLLVGDGSVDVLLCTLGPL